MPRAAAHLAAEIIAISKQLIALLPTSPVEQNFANNTKKTAAERKTNLAVETLSANKDQLTLAAKIDTAHERAVNTGVKSIVNTEFDAELNPGKLTQLTAQRERLIAQLFTDFNATQLLLQQDQLNTIHNLDSVLAERAHTGFQQAKNAILAAKKNKKAINSYQAQ
jgi:hypothetical protein